MSFFNDVIVPVLAILAIIAGIAMTMVGIPATLLYYDCNGFERATGEETRFEALTCYIKMGDRFVTMEEYRHAYTTKQDIKVQIK